MDVVVVGAGISGLLAANWLQKQGWQVLVVDKGRGVGGRMATRRIGSGRCDHGAQFFTARHDEFKAYVADWQEVGLVYHWGLGWSDGSSIAPRQDGHPRYVVKNGMTSLPKHLAQGLDVRLNVTVAELTAVADGWQLNDTDGRQYTSRAILLTSPVPQSLALLQQGGTHLVFEDMMALTAVQYAPCITGLYWVDGSVWLPKPGALQRPEKAVTWIGDNQRKGISPEATLITVQMGPGLSKQLWNSTEEEMDHAMRAPLRRYLADGATFKEVQIKKWRYALPIALHPERHLLANGQPPLAFAGDGFYEPRVEGAALSGLSAARGLHHVLSHETGER